MNREIFPLKSNISLLGRQNCSQVGLDSTALLMYTKEQIRDITRAKGGEANVRE